MKFKPTPVVKWIDGEKWVFKGGKASVPGTSMIVTLEELKEAQNDKPRN